MFLTMLSLTHVALHTGEVEAAIVDWCRSHGDAPPALRRREFITLLRRHGGRIAISPTPNIAMWRRSSMRSGDFKNIAARRIAMAARRQETAIVRVLTQTTVAAANDIALCANS